MGKNKEEMTCIFSFVCVFGEPSSSKHLALIFELKKGIDISLIVTSLSQKHILHSNIL